MEGKLLPWFKENRTKIANYLFYMALTIELVLMIVEKSEISFSYESYVFRATFLLTLLAVIVMKHNLKGWTVIAVIFVLSGYCYVHTGRNDLLRIALFIMASRDIDLKKTMKFSFYLTLVGVIAIALLAVTGVLGDVSLTFDYGRHAGVETRYVFGFGHPNTLFSSVFALILMWIWIYGKRAGVLPYLVAVVAAAITVVITDSRTGMLVMAFTLMMAVFFRIFSKLSEKRWLYIFGGLISPVLCFLFTVQAAWIAEGFYAVKRNMYLGMFYWKLDYRLNNRISNLYYATDDRAGILSRWTLFSKTGQDGYFDIGWARMVYWYGIIPTLIIILAIIAVICVCMKERDIQAMILIVSLGIYTLVEATFVTRYLGRDFFLLIAGVYLGKFFADLFRNKDKKDTRDMKGATNA